MNDVNIQLNDTALMTNSTGIVLFEGLARFADYNWSASKEGYADTSGIITMVNDTTVNLTMNLLIHTDQQVVQGLRWYPNPVSGILNLELQNTGNVYTTVKLFNITKQAVYNGEIAQSKLQIDVRDLDAGLYIITVQSGEHVFTKRIQIVK